MDSLGVVVMFTLRQTTTVPVGAMTCWFTELGLNPAHLPGGNWPAHAFRAACHDYRIRYTHPYLGIALVHPVEEGNSPQKLSFQLIRETRPGRIRGEIVYDKIGKLVLYKPARGRVGATERVRVTVDESMLTPTERVLLGEETERFRGRYRMLRRHNHANRLRTMLRDYLTEDLHAVSLREAGGVYFVPAPFHEVTYRLEEVVRRIGQQATWHVLPVPDEDRQRTMIAHHFTHHLRDRLAKDRWEGVAAACETYLPLVEGVDGEVADLLQDTLAALNEAGRHTAKE